MTLTAPAHTDVFTVRPLTDTVLEQHGHDPRSTYAEIFWLPVIGPTSLWLLRRLAWRLEMAKGASFIIDTEDLAVSLGVGVRQIHGSLSRIVQLFHLALWDPDGTLAVQTRMPPLTLKMVSRFPSQLQAAHAAWMRSS